MDFVFEQKNLHSNHNEPDNPEHLRLFLAIREDKPDDPDEKRYTVYLVNGMTETIEELIISRWAYADDMTTPPVLRKWKNVKPGQVLQIEDKTEADFDFYNFLDTAITFNGISSELRFKVPKYLPAFHKPKPLPIIKKEGYRIDMDAFSTINAQAKRFGFLLNP